MSVCTFIASNCPLTEVSPEKEYTLEINLDNGTINDGADIWNKPDKQIPSRPSFYRLNITR